MKSSSKRAGLALVAIAVVVALGSTAILAQPEEEDEDPMARDLSAKLDDLAFVADSFSKVEEGESLATQEAVASLDWLSKAAREIEQSYDRKGDSSGQRQAEALAADAQDARGELSDYAMDKSSPELCERALRNVLESGSALVKNLESSK
jgi:hypothetical protein